MVVIDILYIYKSLNVKIFILFFSSVKAIGYVYIFVSFEMLLKLMAFFSGMLREAS